MTYRVIFPKKKYLLRKSSLHKLFQSKLLICTQNYKQMFSLGQFYQKAEGHPGLTLWSKNLRKKRFCKLRKCSFTAPKNALFAPLLDIKPFLAIRNLKHCFKWPTPLEWYDRDSLYIWCPYLARLLILKQIH